jgi:transcriptional regulator with XRE-family HTH domain
MQVEETCMDDFERLVSKRMGQVLAELRTARGMTQEDVASALGIGNEAVSRMERGVAMPTVLRLHQYSELFDHPIERILGASSMRPSDMSKQLAMKIERLKPRDRMLVVKIVDELYEHFAAPKQGG